VPKCVNIIVSETLSKTCVFYYVNLLSQYFIVQFTICKFRLCISFVW